MQEINFFGLTFTGRRSNNQDTFATIRINADVLFMAVADGMGGAVGGEIASKLTIDTAVAFLKGKFKEQIEPNSLKSILEEMFLACQNAVAGRLENNPELSGMGTTLTCILIYRNKYVWGNIGDSRLYKLASGKFSQLTKDHTFVEEYRQKFGDDIPEHIAAQSNIITRAIDGRGDKPDLFPSEGYFSLLDQRDLFLLCSDGLLFNKIEDQNTNFFLDYVTGTHTLEETCKQLTALAFHAGSTDNITIVLMSVGEIIRQRLKIKKFKYPPREISSRSSIRNGKKPRKKIRTLILFLAILFLSIGAIFSYFYFKPVANTTQDDEIYQEIQAKQELMKTDSTITKLVSFRLAFPTFPNSVTLQTKIYWFPPNFPENLTGYHLQLMKNGKPIGKYIERESNILSVTLDEFPDANKLKNKDQIVIRLTPKGHIGVIVEPLYHDFHIKIQK